MSDLPDVRVMVGDVELKASTANLHSSMEDLARADLVVSLDSSIPDWLAGLEVQIDGEVAFSGTVLSAERHPDGVHITAASGIELTEYLMGDISAEEFPVQDVVYAAARSAGFSRDRMEIHGLDELGAEPFEIVAPLIDIEVTERMELGSLVLLDRSQGLKALDAFNSVSDDLAAQWHQAHAFALVICEATLLADAEGEGLEVIDATLAWLAVRARYGYALLPDGSTSRFNRECARSLPARSGPVAVRGLGSDRRWLRDPQGAMRREILKFAEADLAWPPLHERLATADRLALLASRDAASSDDPVQRASVISAAWEFYCASASPPALFSKAELSRLKQELPEWLTVQQAERLHEVLGMSNQFSLTRRLRAALHSDDVPVSAEEHETLKRVRNVRNRAVHGSETLEIATDDLDLAASVLSRALVHRMARLAASPARP